MSKVGKVLIVDDMIMHLETAKLYLEKSNIEVYTVADFNSAWSIIIGEQPDLVLLDVVLPGGSGLTLLQKIKENYPTMGVIMMTAFGSEDIVSRALKLGAADYIRKPFKYSALGTMVEEALEKQRALKRQELAVKTLKHAYEELQVSAESIFQCMSAGVLAVDNNLNIRMINDRAKDLLEIAENNIVGQQLYQVLPEFIQTSLLKQTIETEKAFQRHEVKINKGTERVLSVNTDLILDYRKNKIGAVAVIEDITELRRNEQLLRERERLAIVGQMAAGMAHEIKNPLTAIKGFAQIIQGKAADPNLSGYLKVILSEIDRMNAVIQDFLKMAKPKTPEFKQVNINDLVNEMFPFIDSQAFLKNVKVNVETSGYIPPATMDPDQIKQVLLNMVQNGFEAMETGGILTLKTSYVPQERVVCLDIIDTGCGIPEHKIKDLGVPFYTTKPTGTGLGLGICLAIVEQHNGWVEIKSKLGEGTTFSVLLPVDASA